jgi:hypothetical protein
VETQRIWQNSPQRMSEVGYLTETPHCMSALGQKQTSALQKAMSALALKADIPTTLMRSRA